VPNRKIQRMGLHFAEIIKNTEDTNRDREVLQRASDELKEIVLECDARYFPFLVLTQNCGDVGESGAK
jgi:hypothetical protein